MTITVRQRLCHVLLHLVEFRILKMQFRHGFCIARSYKVEEDLQRD